ncbi:MAG: LysM peptidoglycan-binding domain-containing protein [Deltaproteobacteria bacterium]|nr:LysM peptidoglycan-binding domain-containing protein [Deltaproteobacteria bacterium]
MMKTTDLNSDNSDITRNGKISSQSGLKDIPEAFVENAAITINLSKKVSKLQKPEVVLDEALEYCQTSQELRQKGNLDEALEMLDRAYILIVKVDTDNLPGLIQQKEDLRFMISKRILEIYASRSSVVIGPHRAIPITLNKYTQAEIDSFTIGREKRFFIESYKRSGKYRKQIVSEIKAAGLPVELSWLPLIESGFKAQALSKARALGLWQFIPSTGYKFGLKRDTYIDERLDPLKATKAAIAYLKELHRLFGDWSTVLAAYNCGEGRVLRIIRGQNVNYLDNFWDLYEKLPRETARYVPRFLACLHIVNHPEKYGLDKISVDPPLEYESISIRKQIQLEDAAKSMSVSEQVLVELNPELRYKILPDKEYFLRVPKKRGALLLANIEEIPVSKVARRDFLRHRVKPGETLSTIARRYRTNVRKIARANKIQKCGYIVAGKVLKIPRRGSTYIYKSKIKNEGQLVLGSRRTYNVKRGDSLWTIARKYGTTVHKIRQMNCLQNTKLRIGQVLKIPNPIKKHLANAASVKSSV